MSGLIDDKTFNKYLKEMNLSVETEAYIIDLTLRKTLVELISLEKRRKIDENEKEEMVKESIKKFWKNIRIFESINI